MILPRKGEVAGACETEWEVKRHICSEFSPSVTFGATSPLRGRIVRVAAAHGNPNPMD